MKEMVALDEKKSKKIKRLTAQNKLLKAGGVILLAVTAILCLL